MNTAETLRAAATEMRNDYPASEVYCAAADWLDATAVRVDMGREPKDGGCRNHGWRGSREALRFARAYLSGAKA